MPYSDDEIQRLFVAEDDRAPALIYDRYSKPLYGLILRMCNGIDKDANDLLQDTFLKVWKNRSSFQSSRAQLFTWMYSIARNTTLDYLRRHSKVSNREIQNKELNVSLSMDEDAVDLQIHVNNLDEKYKYVLEQIYYQGYTHRELAERTQLPLGTIKSRLKIALRELRKVYKVVPLFFILISCDI